MLTRRFEQVAVVADEEHGVRIAREIVLQPERAFEIEIVGRLVEQQQVGLGEQHGGERHAHAPAAGKFRAGPRLRLSSKPRPARMVAARAGAECASMSAAASGSRRCGASGRRLGLREQRRALRVGGEHDLDQLSGPPGASCATGRCASPWAG
jgi:hypothetical protein